jgi:O-acetyl-ADP-ribose deacetylase (regulator of RNase III)
MIEKSGDLFTTEQNVIGHGVNVVGVMGAGVAKLVADKFPTVKERYVEACQRHALRPGETQLLVVPTRGEPKLIANMASQINPGPCANLELLDSSVRDAVRQCQNVGHDVMAIPQIGCGIGGLTWDEVEPVLAQIEADTDFTFEVWVYEG